MSTRLKHLAVRMHHDPRFADAIYAPGKLASELRDDVNDDERSALRAVDRRAWSTDPLRTMRVLHALLEELPVSCAIVGFAGLELFFASRAFVEVITERRSMAAAFAAWLAPRVGDAAVLEAGLCRARRPRPVPGPGRFVRAPGVEVAVVAAGALAHHVAARQLLAPDPVQRIVKGMRVAPFVPASTDAARDPHEHLLITLDDKGASEVSYASPGLVGLLAPDAPRTLTEMCAAAEALGADPGEGREIVEDLVRERLLVGYL